MAVFLVITTVFATTPGTLDIPKHWTELLALAVREGFVGFMMGYAIAFIFYLCQVSGRLISMQVGLMQSNLFNPILAEEETALGTAMTILSIAIIFATEVHHMILLAFVRSFDLIPAGSHAIGPTNATNIIRTIGNIFRLATQMAAPVIAVNFIVTLSFAILGRTVPTMNVLVLSFAVRIVLGLLVLVLVSVVLAQILLEVIEQTPLRMMQFLPTR